MSQFAQIESLMALAASIDNGQYEELISGLATRITAQGAKDIADAVETLGPENAKLFLPVSRHALRAEKEAAKLEHFKRMQELEYRDKLAKVEANEATSALLVAKQQQLAEPKED